MYSPFNRLPQFGSTDWAARRIRNLLDDEDRRKARLTAQAASRAAQSSPMTSAGAGYPGADEGAPDQPANIPRQSRPGPPPYLALRQTPESRRALIDSIIAEEGNQSYDPFGGDTQYGITQPAIDEYKRIVDDSFNLAPRQISRDQAVGIYDGLIKAYRLDRIADPDLRAQIIDMVVNPGIGATGQILLDILVRRGHDVRIDPTDNVIGSRALGAIRDLVNRKDDAELARINNELVRRRKAYYADKIQENSDKADYRRGWMERADSFRFPPTGRRR